MDLLAGPDDQEATAWRLALPAARHERLSASRVLVTDDHPLLPVASEIRAALDRLADRLAGNGGIGCAIEFPPAGPCRSARLDTRMIRNVAAFGRPPEFFRRCARRSRR